MDVYLIPVGADRYELYCERAIEDPEVSDEAPAGSGWFAALRHRLTSALARIEREEEDDQPLPADEPMGWRERAQRRMLCWIAERVAEWRLLWRLRKQAEATLIFPDDMDGPYALATSRAMLQHEADRHLKWTIVDGLLFCVSGLAALVPGPNVIAYYFGFRLGGHFLSWRGARQGLDIVQWSIRPAAQLTRLRQAMPLAAHERERHVREVAEALHLPRLARFFERVAIRTA